MPIRPDDDADADHDSNDWAGLDAVRLTGAAATPELSDAAFAEIRRLVYDRFGINLTERKRSLVIGRLRKLLITLGFATFDQYVDYLHREGGEKALAELVNRISTNHTYFYREKDHFDFLQRRALPEIAERLKRSGSRDLRIWCAGCATGEEAYMLAMLLREFFGAEYSAWDAGLLATDISQKALTFATAGVYPPERLNLLPAEYLNRYFQRRPDEQWAVRDELKKDITFRKFNLMNETFPFKKSFHIIFCRNVMIYFDQPTRQALVERFHRFTTPGGFFFIGHSESLNRQSCPYSYLMPAVYHRPA